MSEFEAKVVLVTGAARGIGYACAQMFVENGAKVAICDLFEETVTESAEKLGGGTKGYACDITDSEAVKALIKNVEEDMGPIAVLLNNAGITRDNLMMRIKDPDWHSVINTNLNGAFFCSRAVVRGMLKRRYGRIINVSSIVGVHGQAGQANYAASKAGIIGLTKALAHEVASRSVTVNAIAPGYIATEMTDALKEDVRNAIVDRIPMKRQGTAQEVANVVRFLASDLASYVTGAVVPIDGGMGM